MGNTPGCQYGGTPGPLVILQFASQSGFSLFAFLRVAIFSLGQVEGNCTVENRYVLL